MINHGAAIRFYTTKAGIDALMGGMFPSKEIGATFDNVQASDAGYQVSYMDNGLLGFIDYNRPYSDLFFSVQINNTRATANLDVFAMICYEFEIPFIFMSGEIMSSDYVCYLYMFENAFQLSEEFENILMGEFSHRYAGGSQGAQISHVLNNQKFDVSMIDGTHSEKMTKLHRAGLEYLFIMQNHDYSVWCENWHNVSRPNLQRSSMLTYVSSLLLRHDETFLIENHFKLRDVLFFLVDQNLHDHTPSIAWFLNKSIPKGLLYALKEKKDRDLCSLVAMNMIAYALDSYYSYKDCTAMIDDAFSLMKLLDINTKKEMDFEYLLSVVNNPSPSVLRYLMQHQDLEVEINEVIPTILKALNRGYHELNDESKEDTDYLEELASGIWDKKRILSTINLKTDI